MVSFLHDIREGARGDGVIGPFFGMGLEGGSSGEGGEEREAEAEGQGG